MNDSAQLIGANAAAAILGIPVKNGKPSGAVYDTLKQLECVCIQLDGRPVKTWRRGDVETLRSKMVETARPTTKDPVGRASNFGQWQHRVKNLEQSVNDSFDLISRLRSSLDLNHKYILDLHLKIDRLLKELGVEV